MNRKALIEELTRNNCIILKPSTVHGIGVFALTDIKKGQRNIFSRDKSKWLSIDIATIEALPEHSKALVHNFCLYDETHYFVPEYGFKMLDMVIYLNHSESPNIQSLRDGEDFEALTDIPAGTELLINYGTIVSH